MQPQQHCRVALLLWLRIVANLNAVAVEKARMVKVFINNFS
jgi:hypothetical protein